ncbi:UvrD-helicase domain-containing protein [Bacillus sp. NPDC077027]|uniref:UvrD-helicase domain-containing protein n=1 Tax=Bacillus sp. NPDC077027 TaxID=3390548 RepID=UPI003D008F07
MKIIIAGAGAGKTTSMAQKVLERYNTITDGKIIYVITYTNVARDHIRKKVIELNGSIPRRVRIETSHVFLLQEIIFPFHHLLYEQQYNQVSLIKLPENHGYRANKLGELRENNTIHVQEATKVAKWIISGKSDDRKIIKNKREKILAIIQRYLDCVFIDEAQDMDQYLSGIIEMLNNKEIGVIVVGDPKQDLRGRNELRKLIEKYSHNVEYKKENHRCPISHVNFANSYISPEEKQVCQHEEMGEISHIYENDISIKSYVDEGDWCYSFILKKNERFVTQSDEMNSAKNNLRYELKALVRKTDIEDKKVDQKVYLILEKVLQDFDNTNHWAIINRLGTELSIGLTRQDKARLFASLKMNEENNNEQNGILVQSIDKIKGLEGENCLFILTTDLSDYIFKKKTEMNKMINYLYVALTRAKKKLVIMVTSEVENKYGRAWIDCKFESLFSGNKPGGDT